MGSLIFMIVAAVTTLTIAYPYAKEKACTKESQVQEAMKSPSKAKKYHFEDYPGLNGPTRHID